MNIPTNHLLLSAALVLLGHPVVLGAEDSKQLAEATHYMQRAQQLLEQPDANGQASVAQEQAVVSLDALIARLTEKKKQCQGSKQQKQKDSTKPKEDKPKSSKKAGNQAATKAPKSSSGRPGPKLAAAATQMVKDLWGQLPERQQEKILQPLGEEFLPQYAEDIEEYFRGLAEPDNTLRDAP